MTTIEEMDELVNWDEAKVCVETAIHATGAASSNVLSQHPALTGLSDDLAHAHPSGNSFLQQVSDHDFDNSCTLESFEQQHSSVSGHVSVPGHPSASGHNDDLSMDDTPALDLRYNVEWPCFSCIFGGYSCKKIREGRHIGYCTSCVALGLECSSGSSMLAPASVPYAAGQWPVVPRDSHGNNTMAPAEPLSRESYEQASSASTTAGIMSPNTGHADNDIIGPRRIAPPKIGARFSRESVRILKNWLTLHNQHPYPREEEKEALQHQTGLNKTQITNWLANARRRGKVQNTRSESPHVGNLSGSMSDSISGSVTASIEIPQRRGPPALEAMNPLQRWEHSPPEHEPASVAAIARAVTASSSSVLSSDLNSSYNLNYTTDDASSRSLSSISSLPTSQSSISYGSAYSHCSRNSLASFGSAPFSTRGRRRRRRRATVKLADQVSDAPAAPLKTFQCTFCAESFRTKHDWQRHEKSLHLSLERWVCAPHGARALNPENGQLCCVFCGMANPSDAHLDGHNHTACQERTLEERTFYRKDHLNQHLKLVHNVKFIDWSMKQWEVATPPIRSRCGFCGIVMDSWTIRVDHLADHFKTGYSMADWKGGWGFDMPVLEMVENSILPYTRPSLHFAQRQPQTSLS